jgi:hypothetical protein
VDLFGEPEDNVKYTNAIAKAIEDMGHTVELIFTDQRAPMKTVNAFVLKEELDRLMVEKRTMKRDKCWEYVNNWKLGNDILLSNALGVEYCLQFKFLTEVMIAPSTSTNQVLFWQEVIQADAAHMSFGKYTLYSAYAITANDNMSALGLAMLFGNEDKNNWTHFLKFIKKTHLIVDQPNKTILTNQDKGSLVAISDIVPLAGKFHCRFYCQENIVKNVVMERNTKRSQHFDCTIYSAVASLLPCLQPPKKVQGSDALH